MKKLETQDLENISGGVKYALYDRRCMSLLWMGWID